ncbi:unnamed protein product, partial [Dovyalis caffra]
ILLQWILHDWSDDHCLKLLKNCYEAIPDDWKVIVMESVLSITARTSHAAKATSQLDLLMMTHSPGGKERTIAYKLHLKLENWILHDWSDDHCLKLLKNFYEAIPDDGKVIVNYGISCSLITAKTSPAAKATSQLDVPMMIQNPGGKERTEHEFMALATGAGFRGIKYETFVCNFWAMEFFK